MKIFRFVLSSVLITMIAAAPSWGREITAGKVMIVLDASGSMWGKIENESKIVIARRVINDLLRNWDKEIELGLAAYGHRRKGDCNDIEVLVPVGKNKQKEVLAAVAQLQPKGKTPLSNAVRMAAEALKYGEDQATVVLVSDGKETCGVDPCQLGKNLEKNGVDFTAHVIGFGVKKTETSGLRCLAENTGGLYAAAKDAGSLKLALEKTVIEVKKKVVKPSPPKPAPGITVIALHSQGGQAFSGDINWYVFDPKADLNGKRKKIAEKYRGKSGHVFKKLKPGKYLLVAQLADAKYIRREIEIEVVEGKAAKYVVVLNTGQVRFDARLAESLGPFKGDLGFNVYYPKADLSGKYKKLTNFWRVKTGRVFLLPAGDWLVTAQLPDARYLNTRKEIKVSPGGQEAHMFDFNAGRVRFDGRLAEGLEPFKGDLGFTVWEAKADLSGKHKKLTNFWRVKSGRIFLLPAGNWLVTATLPDAKYINTKKEIGITPGGEEAHGFIFNAGRIRIDARLAQGLESLKGDLGFTVYEAKADLSGKHKKLTDFWRVKSGRIYLLPAGNWLIYGTLPDFRHVSQQAETMLNPGGEAVVDINFNAGRVKINTTVNGAAPGRNVGWTVYTAKTDDSGKRRKIANAWRVGPGGITILQQGDYFIQAVLPDDRKITGSNSFSVTAAKDLVVDVDMKKQ